MLVQEVKAKAGQSVCTISLKANLPQDPSSPARPHPTEVLEQVRRQMLKPMNCRRHFTPIHSSILPVIIQMYFSLQNGYKNKKIITK